MTDNDVLTEIRGRLEPARLTVPLDTVVERGRIRRRRRRLLAAAEAIAGVAAAAAIAVAAIPGPVTATTPSTLAAWTVTATDGHMVQVRIHSILDLPGLQAALRAHGVPAFVIRVPADGGNAAQRCPRGIAPDSFTIPPGEGITDTGELIPPQDAGKTFADPIIKDAGIFEFSTYASLVMNIQPDAVPAGFAVELFISPAPRLGDTLYWDQLVTPDGQCLPGWRHQS